MIGDFNKYALSKGVSSHVLSDYSKYVSGYVNPSIIEERQMHVTQMDVFSKLIQERQIFLGTSIDADVANIINAQLLYLDSVSSDDITILINSPGGVCYDGLSIIDTMNYVSSNVGTMCTGLSASMGAVILSNGEKGKRFALPHSRVMIHQPLGGARGQATEIEIEYKQIMLLKKELCGILAENSGQTLEKVLEDCERDHWLIAQEAKEYGLIDDVIRKK